MTASQRTRQRAMRLDALELRVPPLALTAVAALAIVLLPAPAPRVPVALAWSLAAIVIAVGVTIAVLGVIAFRRAGTTVDPRYPGRSERVVRTGIYARTRNPMYLGFVAVLLGLGVGWQSPIGLVVALATAIYLDRFQIRPEERRLLKRFGDEYEGYCRSVRRWL